MKSIFWNPWHGCHKISPGCQHCYVYRMDHRHDRDASIVKKTKNFDLPISKRRDGSYRIPSGETVFTCLTSDFFLEDADAWREQAWAIIRRRADCQFHIITKRIARFDQCLPPDWGTGYENVYIHCTVEDRKRANERLPIFAAAPIVHKSIICEPLLERIDLSPWLNEEIEEVSVGGESGESARVCRYEWVVELHRQCAERGILFTFHQTGARLEKDGRVYTIPRNRQFEQAKKAEMYDLPQKNKPPEETL